MFNINVGQRQPKPAIIINYSDKYISTGDMVTHFKKSIKEIEKLSFIDESIFIRNFSQSIKSKIEFNTVIKFNKNYIASYNIVKNKKRRSKSNSSYGVTVYLYFTEASKIEKFTQYYDRFVINFKKGAVLDVFTKDKPFSFIFKMSKNNEEFYVKTKAEKDFLELDGYTYKTITYIESDGKYFEIVKEIKHNEFKVIDTLTNKIKIFKTQKAAKANNKPFYQIEIDGISGKNYFTMDFENSSNGFFKVYGDVEGYVLVETVVSILNGEKRMITFIKKTDKETIKRISNTIPITD